MTLVVESHIVFVRKKRLKGWKQGNTPEKRFWSPCLWRGFLFAMPSIKRGRTRTSRLEETTRNARLSVARADQLSAG